MADEASSESKMTLEKVLQAYGEKAQAEFKPYIILISEGLERCITLVTGSKKAEKEIASDILRAVVVLNHAYLEDFLRTLALAFLPTADEKALNAVPLAGVSRSERAEKFYLGKLLQHRGRTVDDVIRESVSQHMEYSTFNNVTEVMSFLDSIGVKVKEDMKSPLQLRLNSDIPEMLDSMMRRRHHIVHRADKAKKGDGLQAIDSVEVMAGLVATFAFMFCVTQTAFMKRYSFEDFKKKVDEMAAVYEKTLKDSGSAEPRDAQD